MAEASAVNGEDLVTELQLKQEAGDFTGVLTLIRDNKALLDSKLAASGVKSTLRKATKDRVLVAFVDSVGFGERSLTESLGRLDRLISFAPGVRVLSKAYGLGEVKRIDSFYRRITVDFRLRRGHQFTFDAACETLVLAPEKHILVTAAADPARVEQMLKEQPGDFVKEMLSSFGDMPVTKLEELCVANGFVKAANWKAFWDRARADLKKDRLVEIPLRRAEALHLKSSAESYGDGWFTAFAQMTDPVSILSSVKELAGSKKIDQLDDPSKEKIADRLVFALRGARGVDDALYCRIAFLLVKLSFKSAAADEKAQVAIVKARQYLRERNRYLKAAKELPARDTGDLVVFMTADDRETHKHELFAKLPEMCFAFLTSTLDYFSTDADCEEAVVKLLKDPHPPATLVVAILGRFEDFAGWKKLPPLALVLMHAIALGEGRQAGETLRMQNVVRRLFADNAWLTKIFTSIGPGDRVNIFERFQASTTWDPSTHRLITVRMTRLDPALAGHLVKLETKREEERVTSVRSHREKQAAYDKLVTVDIPANTKRIEFARSYGDLSENAEYQYAKDEERALQQKQNLMSADLNAVKPVDFADVATDEVRAGVTVVIAAPDGEKTYTILGEWDNDPALNIISNKTKLAANMLGKHPGDVFELPTAEGTAASGTIVRIEALSEAVKTWVRG